MIEEFLFGTYMRVVSVDADDDIKQATVSFDLHLGNINLELNMFWKDVPRRINSGEMRVSVQEFSWLLHSMKPAVIALPYKYNLTTDREVDQRIVNAIKSLGFYETVNPKTNASRYVSFHIHSVLRYKQEKIMQGED